MTNSETNTADSAENSLDTRGLVCPEPLMLVRNRVRDMATGEILHIFATDPSTARDFSNFCRFLGHELQRQEQTDTIFEYWIVKG
jgi:tRNA 2-thiouridine synthesizing protein A